MSDYNPEQEGSPGSPMRWTATSSHVPSQNVQATMHQMTTQMQTVIEAAERAAEAIRLDAQEQARRHLAEAQRKADRLTAERVGLISELTDDLVRHAANVRDHSERMVRALEDAISSVTDKLEQPAMSDPFAARPEVQPQAVGQHAGWQPPVPASPVPRSGFVPPPASDTGLGFGDTLAPPPPPATAPPPPIAIEPLPPAPGPPVETAAADVGSASENDGDGQPETAPVDAILYASRLAANGTDPAVIATELTSRYGIADPDPIVDRVLGGD